MSIARTITLARLQRQIDGLEGGIASQGHSEAALPRAALGHAEADATLRGGVALGAVHEVFPEIGRHGVAATGFVAALMGRLTLRRRGVLWIRQDVAAHEYGDLAMAGFAELGLDAASLIVVHVHDAESALRVAADALACNGLGAVVVEIWGQPKVFDFVASRKLTLAASVSGVTALLLRLAAPPHISAAETRWLVRSAHSPPTPEWSAWGEPMFDVQLIRNRHGPLGRWIMRWNCDECVFAEPSAYSQSVAVVPADRSPRAANAPQRHRTLRLRSG